MAELDEWLECCFTASMFLVKGCLAGATSVIAMLLLAACSHEGGAPADGGRAGAGDGAGTGDGVGTGGGAEADDGAPAACPSYDGVQQSGDIGFCNLPTFQGSNGGPGTICNSALQEDRYIHGKGFDDREGQRVVSRRGETTVEGGAFDLYVGYFGGCDPQSILYRFDVVQDGACGDGDDVFYITMTSSAEATPAEPGAPDACASFPSGLDLGLASRCFPGCGVVRTGLFEDGQLLAKTAFELHTLGGFEGSALAGLLVAGKQYEVRYYKDDFGCRHGPEHGWTTTFTAKPGRNVVTLDAQPGSEPTDCF